MHADHQGSIIAKTNGFGSYLGKLTYDNFGIPATTNVGRFGYTGQIWLKELGLFHYKARMYSPRLGRFLQTDLIFYADQMNMYAYVGKRFVIRGVSMNNYASFLIRFDSQDMTKMEIKSPMDFMSKFSGFVFGEGLYRVINKEKVVFWNEMVGEYFDGYSNKINCFGIDWLGRVFAVDNRVESKGRCTLMFDPSTAEVLKIPADFDEFHNNEIVNYSNESLDSELFYAWLSDNKPLQFSECVSHKIPLFLGGQDNFDNMDVIDVEVNWEILKEAHKGILKDNTQVGSVSIK